MYTLLLSSAFGLLLLLSLGFSGAARWPWAAAWGLLGFFAANAAVGYVVGRKVKAMMAALQGIMLQGQRRMQEKTQAWRFRPPGSVRQAQVEITKMQHGFIEKALDYADGFAKYEKWSPLLARQVATMRMQLNFQDRNFQAVDALLPKCLLLDPMTVSMAMARAYMRDGYARKADAKGRPVPNAIDKYFEKGAARLRYGQGALLYGLYAWIQIRGGDVDGAFATLLRSSRKMENDCLKRNVELLRNNKAKQFSLAGLGDEWYALGLEEPRVKMQRPSQRPF